MERPLLLCPVPSGLSISATIEMASGTCFGPVKQESDKATAMHVDPNNLHTCTSRKYNKNKASDANFHWFVDMK